MRLLVALTPWELPGALLEPGELPGALLEPGELLALLELLLEELVGQEQVGQGVPLDWSELLDPAGQEQVGHGVDPVLVLPGVPDVGEVLDDPVDPAADVEEEAEPSEVPMEVLVDVALPDDEAPESDGVMEPSDADALPGTEVVAEEVLPAVDVVDEAACDSLPLATAVRRRNRSDSPPLLVSPYAVSGPGLQPCEGVLGALVLEVWLVETAVESEPADGVTLVEVVD